MKKVTALLLSLIMLFSMVGNAFAAGTTKGVISASSVEKAEPGSEVKVTISMDSNPGFWMGTVKVSYDEALEFVRCEGTTLFGDQVEFTPNTSKNPIQLMWENEEDALVTATGAVAVLTFKVPADATVDNVYKIRIEDADIVMADTDGEPVPFAGKNGTITINGVHSYDITASATEGGSIDPSGTVKVKEGESQTFTIAASEGYHLKDVTVDGESVGRVPSYIFQNVSDGHSIAASFAKHDYKAEVTEPTCTEGGYTTYTCACGDNYRADETDATGHAWSGWTVTKPATETEKGEEQRTCSICQKTETQEIPELAHTHALVKTPAKESTCKEQGNNEYYTCSGCGKVYKDAEGKTETTVEEEKLPLAEHTEETIPGKAATCTETGLTDGTKCSVCGEVLAAQETIPAKGHDWDGGKVTKEPTCTEKGERTLTCKSCDATTTREIAANGHDWEWVIDKEATETEDGSKHQECKVCHEKKESVVIPAIGTGIISVSSVEKAEPGSEVTVTVSFDSNPGFWMGTVKIAYDESLTFVSCENTGLFGDQVEFTPTTSKNPIQLMWENEEDALVTATGAAAVLTFKIPADATVENVYKVSITEIAMADTEGDPISFTSEDGTITVNTCAIKASATEGGSIDPSGTVKVKEGESQTFTIAASEGYHLKDVTVDGESVGKVTTYTFSDVHGVHTIAAAFEEHSYTPAVTNATCTEDGHTTYTCACGDSYTEVIPAKGHTSDGNTDCSKATKCSVCGTVLKAAGEHAWNEGVVTKEATCTENGEKLYTCGNCGATKTETIPAAHKWGQGVVTKEPTCTEKGVRTYTCSVCGATKTEEIATVAHQYDANGVCTVCGEKKPSGGGGGGGGGSATVTPTEPEITTGGGTTVAEIEAKVTTSGTTSKTAVTQDTLDKAIEAAENAAGKAGTDAAVEIVVNTSAKATEVKVDLPAEGLESFADSEAQSLTISSGVGSVTISPEAAASMADQAQSDTVTVTISEVTQPEKALNERQLAAVGDAPVYELCVTSNGKYISQFDGGLITVSLPYTLKAGEDPNGVVVYYVDDLGNLQRVRAMYDVKTQSIIFTTNHFSFYMVRYESNAAAAARFTDVPFDAYYQSAVGWAVSHGVTGGVTETTFAPSNPCTRAQAVTFLWRAAGSPAPKSAVNPFTDVKAGAYYYDAVLWAVENGITKGTTDTTFSPNATCSRAQIVTFLWRSQKSPAAGTVNPFTDVAAGAYYQNAVLWAVKNGITGGTTATTFSPNNNCTRAQIVTFLYRNVNG